MVSEHAAQELRRACTPRLYLGCTRPVTVLGVGRKENDKKGISSGHLACRKSSWRPVLLEGEYIAKIW